VGKLDFGRVGRVIDHVIDKFVQLVLETRKGYNQTVFCLPLQAIILYLAKRID
jgi:hypothetical protein